MLKKFNVALVSFFSVLTISYGIGYAIFIPIVLFFLIRSIKNIYIIGICSLVSLFLFTGTTYLISYLLLIVVILFILWIMEKLNKGFYIYLFVVLLNVFSFLITYQSFDSFLTLGIVTVISLLLYLYFERNLVESLRSENHFYNPSYLEIIISLVVIMGAVNYHIMEINLGFLMAMYFAMYFAISFKNVYTMLYSLITMIILLFYFNIPEAIFIPFVSAFYFLPFVYPLITTNVFACSVLLSSTTYNEYAILALMIASIVFEILKIVVINEDLADSAVKEHIYTKVVDNVSSEILGFASFLEKFAVVFQTPKEYNERLSEGMKTIVQQHCMQCQKKKECFNTHKGNIYNYFKNLLLKVPLVSNDHKEFFRYCAHSGSIEETTRIMNSRYNYDLPNVSNVGLIAQINGVAQAMRKYTIDLIAKDEIKYDVFVSLKRRIINYGYELVLYNVVKTFQDDYLIKLGIKKEKFDNIVGIIKLISDSLLPSRVSVILDYVENEVNYINVVPKVKLDVIYGVGGLSNEGDYISGDNVMVKDLATGKFISAISDGMGKGYSAFCESSMTLNLVNDITKSNIESSTALEILNSFYVVQEYLERYATLDFVEINKYTKKVNFYKMGATTSYIVKESGQIEKVLNRSLPFGLEDTIESHEYVLDNNDLIIMTSDGVFENVLETASLDHLISSVKELSPQKIVYELINYTINNNMKTSDDMTVVVMKVRYA